MAQNSEAKGSIKEIVRERIDILLNLAITALGKKDAKHAKRYVFLARKLSTRYNCRFTPSERMKFCKGCGMPSIPGKNTTIRLRKRERAAEYACSCGKTRRFKYGNAQK